MKDIFSDRIVSFVSLKIGLFQEDQEISAYAYERTLKLAERVKLLKDLKLAEKEFQLQVAR